MHSTDGTEPVIHDSATDEEGSMHKYFKLYKCKI